MMHREVQTSASKSTLPTLPLRAELQQCSICDHCHHAPTRPGPARSGQAHGTGRSGTGLPSAPQQRQQRSPHDGVVVCMCAKCKQNRVRLCTITGLTNSRSIYLSSSTLAGWLDWLAGSQQSFFFFFVAKFFFNVAKNMYFSVANFFN